MESGEPWKDNVTPTKDTRVRSSLFTDLQDESDRAQRKILGKEFGLQFPEGFAGQVLEHCDTGDKGGVRHRAEPRAKGKNVQNSRRRVGETGERRFGRHASKQQSTKNGSGAEGLRVVQALRRPLLGDGALLDHLRSAGSTTKRQSQSTLRRGRPWTNSRFERDRL